MNLMAVPAALMSMTGGMVFSALMMTFVSSQSDKLSGTTLPLPRAWRMSARLLMLFDAGRFIVVSMWLGAVILYLMSFYSDVTIGRLIILSDSADLVVMVFTWFSFGPGMSGL